MATGAGNVDLSLPLGHAQNGAAMLAFEITVSLTVSPFIFLQTEMILHGLEQLQRRMSWAEIHTAYIGIIIQQILI